MSFLAEKCQICAPGQHLVQRDDLVSRISGTPPSAKRSPRAVLPVCSGGAVCLFVFIFTLIFTISCTEHSLIASERDGSTEPDAQIQPDAAPSNELRFTEVHCVPDVLNGEPLPQGVELGCEFRVVGITGRTTELSCEDGWGEPVDCFGGWSIWMEPVGQNPLPINDGYFWMHFMNFLPPWLADGGLVWVADDGYEQARLSLQFQQIPNEPPEVWVECSGDAGGFVTVQAGDSLQCQVHTFDPNPNAHVAWEVTRVKGPPPVNSPTPTWGGGPGVVSWSWSTDPAEGGELWRWRFWASDGPLFAEPFDLSVQVQ